MPTDEQLRCRPIVFWKCPVDPSASQDIQFGVNIETKVMAVAAISPLVDARFEVGGRITSNEGYERRAVDSDSRHLDFFPLL